MTSKTTEAKLADEYIVMSLMIKYKRTMKNDSKQDIMLKKVFLLNILSVIKSGFR